MNGAWLHHWERWLRCKNDERQCVRATLWRRLKLTSQTRREQCKFNSFVGSSTSVCFFSSTAFSSAGCSGVSRKWFPEGSNTFRLRSPNPWSSRLYKVAQNGTVFCTPSPLTSSNINRFSKLFHCQNQEKTCNNTITKDPTIPQVCRYTTL